MIVVSCILLLLFVILLIYKKKRKEILCYESLLLSFLGLYPFQVLKFEDRSKYGENRRNHPLGYDCFRCGKHYKRKETLSRHLRLECGTDPKFRCEHCSQRFKRREHLVAHTKSKHQFT